MSNNLRCTPIKDRVNGLRVRQGPALLRTISVTEATGVRVHLNGRGTVNQITRDLRPLTQVKQRLVFQRRGAMALVDSTACAAARLIRLTGSRPLNALSCRGQNVQRIRTRLGRNDHRRCLHLTARGPLRHNVLILYLRLTVRRNSFVFKGDLTDNDGSLFRVLRVRLLILLGRQVRRVRLSSRDSLLTRRLVRQHALIIMVIMYNGELSSEERLICCTRLRVAMGNRHRDTKGEDNYRRRCVK